jgi:hypothetical protein
MFSASINCKSTLTISIMILSSKIEMSHPLSTQSGTLFIVILSRISKANGLKHIL